MRIRCPGRTNPLEAGAGTTGERGMWKVAATCAIGTTIEYYDFTLYAVATALVFNRIFFPANDPLVGSLLAFVTFFVGYCARPLGGIVFGHLGDRIGRKKSLLITVVVMGAATFLVGLVPSYDTAGIYAPIALVTLRFLQGIGIGGEYGGGMVMVVEHAPPARRGFYSAFVHIGVPAGLLLPLLLLGILNSSLTDAQFPRLGLAHSVSAEHRAGRTRRGHSNADSRDARLRRHARARRNREAAAGRCAARPQAQHAAGHRRAHRGKRPLQHLCGVRHRLRGHGDEAAPARGAERHDDRGGARMLHPPVLRLAVRQDRQEACLRWGHGLPGLARRVPSS
jgi:hypothetical protein